MIDLTRPDPLRLAYLRDKRNLQIRLATERMRKILRCDRRYLAECADLGFLEGGSIDEVFEFRACAEGLAHFYEDMAENAAIAIESLQHVANMRRYEK